MKETKDRVYRLDKPDEALRFHLVEAEHQPQKLSEAAEVQSSAAPGHSDLASHPLHAIEERILALQQKFDSVAQRALPLGQVLGQLSLPPREQHHSSESKVKNHQPCQKYRLFKRSCKVLVQATLIWIFTVGQPMKLVEAALMLPKIPIDIYEGFYQGFNCGWDSIVVNPYTCDK